MPVSLWNGHFFLYNFFMNLESWKPNLIEQVEQIKKLSDESLLNQIKKDEILFNCIIDFFNPSNLNDIVLLYGNPLWEIKSKLSAHDTIRIPYLEGITFNKIKWNEKCGFNNRNIQLSYLTFNNTIDPLYELTTISQKYEFKYDLSQITLKCLIDNRTDLYVKNKQLSIETRCSLIVNNIL